MTTLSKYELWIQKHIDPTMLIDESRAYAANSSKYYIYSNAVLFWLSKELNYDPYGYYKPRSIAGRNPGLGMFYYADFPMDSDHWLVTPTPEKDISDKDEKQFANWPINTFAE